VKAPFAYIDAEAALSTAVFATMNAAFACSDTVITVFA
jgi:hypothetical protein